MWVSEPHMDKWHYDEGSCLFLTALSILGPLRALQITQGQRSRAAEPFPMFSSQPPEANCDLQLTEWRAERRD